MNYWSFYRWYFRACHLFICQRKRTGAIFAGTASDPQLSSPGANISIFTCHNDKQHVWIVFNLVGTKDFYNKWIMRKYWPCWSCSLTTTQSPSSAALLAQQSIIAPPPAKRLTRSTPWSASTSLLWRPCQTSPTSPPDCYSLSLVTKLSQRNCRLGKAPEAFGTYSAMQNKSQMTTIGRSKFLNRWNNFFSSSPFHKVQNWCNLYQLSEVLPDQIIQNWKYFTEVHGRLLVNSFEVDRENVRLYHNFRWF